MKNWKISKNVTVLLGLIRASEGTGGYGDLSLTLGLYFNHAKYGFTYSFSKYTYFYSLIFFFV